MSLITCKEYATLPDDPERVVIDVRRLDEWEAGHMDEAVHIQLKILEAVVEERLPNKKAHIIMCCQAGGRAAVSADILRSLGYTNVQVLDGGFDAYCATDHK